MKVILYSDRVLAQNSFSSIRSIETPHDAMRTKTNNSDRLNAYPLEVVEAAYSNQYDINSLLENFKDKVVEDKHD